MIQVQHLTKYFGPVMAIRDVSFDVDRGEVVGFLGPNGAGKTTTMRILTSYLPATKGIARVADFDVMTESLDVRRNIGYLQESVPLYPEMRVEEYLHFRAKLKGVPRRDRIRRIDYVLERCRLVEVRRRLTGTLSKGYRQRVGLADAMVHNPPILILDEPTAGLDPIQIRETLALIKELGRDHTVLLSTHILSEVETVCERVIIIAYGQVTLAQRLDEIDSAANTRVMVDVRATADQAMSVLRSVSGVGAVQQQGDAEGIASFEVSASGDQDLRESIAKIMQERHLLIRRLERKRRKLEDAYFEAIKASNPLKV